MRGVGEGKAVRVMTMMVHACLVALARALSTSLPPSLPLLSPSPLSPAHPHTGGEDDGARVPRHGSKAAPRPDARLVLRLLALAQPGVCVCACLCLCLSMSVSECLCV
jgi:hypothetical protein